MATLAPATADETRAWQADWLARQGRWRAALGYSSADVTAWVERAAARRSSGSMTFTHRIDDRCAGFVALSRREGSEWGLDDLWVESAYRRRGHGRTMREAAEQWCREQGATTLTVTCADDPAHRGLFAGYRLIAQHMARAVATRPVLPAGLVGKPLTGKPFDDWMRESITGYAHDRAAAGLSSLETAKEHAAADMQRLLPDGENTTGHSIWTLEASGEAVAHIWLMHSWGVSRSYIYSVGVDPSHRGRGFGKAAMALGEQLAFDAGDRTVELNVFGDNSTAIALYDRLGYVVTEQYRVRNLDGKSSRRRQP